MCLQSWLVDTKVGGSGTPSGCTSLSVHATTKCDITGLPSGTPFAFSVKLLCVDSALDSTFSATSATVSTAVPAAAPVLLTPVLSSTSSNTIILGWTPGSNNSCSFLSWSVTCASGCAVGTVPACCASLSQSSVSCQVSGLHLKHRIHSIFNKYALSLV